MFLPEFSVEEPVNALSGNFADAVTSTPAYKQIAVKVEVLEPDATPPLPRSNPRFGNPTPRRGVEVERKWARPDYAPPPAPDKRKGGLI
jgi:formate dehydrogenase major subunit